MRKNVQKTSIRTDCDTVQRAWEQVRDMQLPNLTFEGFSSEVQALDSLLDGITQKEKELEILRIQRNDLLRKVNDHCVRARLAAKLKYGADSKEYNYFGGTPAFLRKTAQRTATTDTGTATTAQQN